jgi:hypothetical protein
MGDGPVAAVADGTAIDESVHGGVVATHFDECGPYDLRVSHRVCFTTTIRECLRAVVRSEMSLVYGDDCPETCVFTLRRTPSDGREYR